MRKKLLVLSLLLVSGVSAEEVPEVQVTATRVEVPVEHVGDDVDIITQEEIKKYGFTSIADVLKYVAGVHISSNGGWGKQISVFMLGLDSRDILVLVDGVPVNDPSNPNGAANFEWLDLSNVERIEVLKGSQSSIYGSEAVAGVINIITSKPNKDELSVNLEAGKYQTFKERVYTAKVFREGFVAFSGENFKTLGFSASSENAGQYYNSDHDPYHYTTSSFSIGYSPSESFRFTGNFFLKGGYTDYDQGRTDYDKYFANFRVELIQSENLIWELKFSNNEEERKESWGGYFKGTTRYVTLSPTYYINENTFLKTGMSYRYEIANTSSFSTPGVKRYFIRSLFMEGHTRFYDLFLTGAVRIDEHEKFGSHGTYKLSAAYNFLDSGTTLKAQYGTGFKAPTLNQLYGLYTFYQGNPNLEPEESEGWILGINQRLLLVPGQFAFNYFKNHVWSIISPIFDSNTGKYVYMNSGKVITEGTELKLDMYIFKNLQVFGTYTHLRVSSESVAAKLKKPKYSYNVGFNTNYQKLKFSLWVEHYSHREDIGGQELPSFTTYNCYASYQLNDRVNFYLKGVNLTDKDYELAYGYNTMGRAFFAGVNVNFK